MAETDNYQLPYPRPVGDGADVSYWIQRLAEATDAELLAISARLAKLPAATHTQVVTYTAAIGAGLGVGKDVVFPAGLFVGAPNLAFGCSDPRISVSFAAESSAGFRISAWNYTSSSSTTNFRIYVTASQ